VDQGAACFGYESLHWHLAACREKKHISSGESASQPLPQYARSAAQASFGKNFPEKMPASKSSATVPKGWPSNIVYLHSPVLSKKLSADMISRLSTVRSDLQPDTQVWKTNGPHSNVRITAVADVAHPAHGQHALYATQHLPPDTFILPYLGYVHDQTDIDQASDYDLSLDRELGIGVDAFRMGNEARFINDYRGVFAVPNAEFRDILVDVGAGRVEKRVGVFVLSAGKSGKRAKGIGRGQEILVSYGKGFWSERQSTQE
jgi:hypothetical protein